MLRKLWNQYSYTIIFISLSFLFGFILIHQIETEMETTNDEFMEVDVVEGESLWMIAKKYEDDSELDTSEFIHTIEQMNEPNE